MNTLRLELPWKLCSGSKNLRHAGKGHGHHPDYLSSLEFIWAAAHNELVRTDWPTDAIYRVEMVVVPPDRRWRDAYNYGGVILDGLQIRGKVFEDDYQVVESSIRRAAPDPERPRIEVLVRVLPPEADPCRDEDDDAGQ